MEIRRARKEDAEKILDFCKIIGGETDNLTYGTEGVGFTIEQEESYLESIYTSDRNLYLVAIDDGEIVGSGTFSSYSRSRLSHRGEIALCVKKSMWGKHIGSQLMEKLLDFAKKNAKVELVSLEVRCDNVRAISLYEKFGFKKIGTFKGFLKIYNEYADCYMMEKFL